MNKPHLPLGHLGQPAARAGRPMLAWAFPPSSILALVVLVHLATALCARSALVTWDADPATPGAQDGGGIWSAAASNWWNGAGDNGWNNGDSANFGSNSGAAGSVIVTNAGITVSSITFNAAGSGNYTVTTTNGSILTLAGNPTLTANADATIGLVLSGNGFTKEGSGRLSLNPGSSNNTFTNTTIINNGTLALAAGSDSVVQVSSTNILINPGATLLYSTKNPVPVAATLTVNGGLLTNANTTSGKALTLGRLTLDNNGIVVGTFSQAALLVTNYDVRSGVMLIPRLVNDAGNIFPLTKSTAGTVTVDTASQSAGSQGFIVTVNAGTLIMEYLNPGPNGDTGTRAKYGAGALTLGGGAIRHLYPASATGGRTESGITGTTVKPGATSLVITNNHLSSGYTLALAGITRNPGGTVDFTKVTAGGAANFTTTTANVNGILGGWATFAGTDWALGSPIAAASASYLTSNDPTQWTATTNISLSLNPTASLDNTTIYSLRLTNGPTITVNATKTLTLASGGLLVVGSSPTTITGGSLAGASGTDLIVQQYSSADLNISSDLADNITATALTKSGPGKLVLTGGNNMTGTNSLNGGIVEVSDLARLASGLLAMNAGTLRYTGGDATSTRAITLNGGGGVFDVSSAGATLSQTAAITGSGATLGDLGGLAKIGSGTLVLTASNYFNGALVVSNGTLLVNGTNAFDPATFGAGSVAVYGGTLGGNGRIGGNVAVKNGGTISPGASAGTLTLGANLVLENGSTGLFAVTNAPGASDQLVVQGNLAVTNATICLSVLGSPLAAGTYTLIQYSGAKAGSFNPTPVITGGAIDGSPTIDEGTPGQINLVVNHSLVITSQPADTVTPANSPATFSVGVAGTAPISYQWYYYGDNTNNAPTALTDATNASFTISSAQSSDSGYYRVVITNDYSSVTSRLASLFVGNVAPVVTGPTDQTVIAGHNATFSAFVFGNPTPSLQWQTNGMDIAGATGSSLTFANVPYALDGTTVSLIASNAAGVVTNSATLTVLVTPVITAQPTSITVNVGDTATFTAAATGAPTPSLQWRRNGAPISGATGATLTIASAQGSDIGAYTLLATNIAGSTTSSNALLTVNSTTLAAVAFSPANGATGICLDTPLYITFTGAVSTVNAGKVCIYNATNPAAPVDTLDMSTNQVVTNGVVGIYNVQARTIGGATYRTFPVLMIASNVAAVYPHSGVLTTNQTYYVTLDAGVFQDTGGAYFTGITNTSTWQFATRTSGLVAGSSNVVVAADGSGDFCTVQGAVDFVPTGNTNYVLVNLRNGVYREIVFLNTKNNVTFRGQDRHQTLITCVNNDTLNTGTSARPMFRVKGSDVAISNLTLTNATPKGGSQAEALRVGDGSKRFIACNADLDSFQDTVLVNNSGDSAYFRDCHIQGDTDFIWGSGTIYFTNCEIMALSTQSHLTQARTDATTNGFAFVGCQLTRASTAVTNCDLGRDGGNTYPYGQVAYVNCLMDSHILPAGWIDGGLGVKSTLRFWEYQSVDLTGTNLVDVSQRASWSQQILFNTATNVQDVVFWLYGWVPQLPPNLLSPPDISSPVWVGGQFGLTVNGPAGPDYGVQASTNLVDWQTVFTTNSPATPFEWTDPDTGAFPMRFYRIVVGSPLP